MIDEWVAIEARTSGWCIVTKKTGEVIIGSQDEYGHFGPLSKTNAERIVVCVNACRGLDTKELQEHGIVGAVDNELSVQDEIIKNLIGLVEHYGNCYNHNLEDYIEYVEAIKYMDDK